MHSLGTIRVTPVIALLLVTVTALGQSKTERAQVQWGPELSDSKDGDFQDVFGYTEEHVYMTVLQKKEVFIQKMDMGFHVAYKKVLPLEIDKKDHRLELLQVFGERILVFTTFFDKKEKTNNLYLRMFSTLDMSPIGRMQRVADISVDSRRAKGSFDVKSSPDEKTILVNLNLPYEKEASERFGLRVFDDEMNVLWEREVELPYKDSEFAVRDLRVDDDGSVIMVGVKFAEKSEAKELRRDKQATYEYHLLVYRKDDAQPDDHPIRVKDKFLQDLTLSLGDDGDILCGGFFGNKGSFTVRGTFFLRLDRASKAVVHESYKDFSDDFITQYMTEKEEKKATKKADKKGEDLELYSYDLREIVRTSDGGAVIVGEQYQFYVTTHTMSTPNGGTTTTTTYHYVYNDIIVVNVNPEGNIDWAVKVPKRQHTTNDGGYYSSYALHVKNERIYLVFNDTGENLFLQSGDKVKQFELKGKDALITLATVDASGMSHREALLAPDRRDAFTRPKACVQIDDDRMFVYAARKKDYRFGVMTFE